MSETYLFTQACDNCGSSNKVLIPKGTTIDSFMRGYKCYFCGCSVRYSSMEYELEKYRMKLPDNKGTLMRAVKPSKTVYDLKKDIDVLNKEHNQHD
jgi:hypothetical protein